MEKSGFRAARVPLGKLPVAPRADKSLRNLQNPVALNSRFGSVDVFGFTTWRASALLFVCSVLSVWSYACVLPQNAHGPDVADDARLSERQLGREGLAQRFSVEQTHRVSPWLAAEEDGATRAGFLLEMQAAQVDRVITLEARGYDENGVYSPWMAANYTFSEGVLRVARVDFPQPMKAIQVRFLAAELEAIQAFTYAAVVPANEPRLDDLSGEHAAPDFQLHLPSTQRWALLDGVRPREDWEARDTLCNQSDPVKTRISVHHTVSPADDDPGYPARMRALQAYHMDVRGFCDLGYHMVVTLDGRVWEGRNADLQGAHVYGNNPQNLGISLMGCFDSSEDCRPFPPTAPPEDLIDGLVGVIASASNFYELGITSETVLGHRDNPDQSTACPGDQVWQRMGEIRSEAILRREEVYADAGPGDAGTEDGGFITPNNLGRVQGVIWDIAVTPDPGEAASMGARIDTAEITCSCGQTATARANDAYWLMDVPPGRHTFTATAPGYASSSREFRVATDDLIWASIGLSPEDLAVRLTVAVSELKSGDPVNEARVKVTGADSDLTDVAGGISFDLTQGEVLVQVSKSGYVPVERTLELVAGEDQAIGVRLERVGEGTDGGDIPWWPGGNGNGGGDDNTCACDATTTADAGLPGWGLMAALGLPLLLRRRRVR